jgi:hypothetical protein
LEMGDEFGQFVGNTGKALKDLWPTCEANGENELKSFELKTKVSQPHLQHGALVPPWFCNICGPAIGPPECFWSRAHVQRLPADSRMSPLYMSSAKIKPGVPEYLKANCLKLHLKKIKYSTKSKASCDLKIADLKACHCSLSQNNTS